MPPWTRTAAIRMWTSAEMRGTYVNGFRAQGGAGFAAVRSVVKGRGGGWRDPARYVLAHGPGTFPPLGTGEPPPGMIQGWDESSLMRTRVCRGLS